MYAFAYHHPSNVQDALAALADEDAKLLAGGQTLIPTMKQRLASPASIIDLGGIAELAGISREGDAIVIGAMTRHADVADSAVVQGSDPGARGAGAPDRRSRRPQSRHDRRLDRQQRPRRRLSRRRAGARRDDRDQQTRNRRRRLFQGSVRDRAGSAGDHHARSASRSRRKPPIRSSAIPPRATRWSGSSSPRRRAASGSR